VKNYTWNEKIVTGIEYELKDSPIPKTMCHVS